MFWSVSIKWTSSLFFLMFVLDSLNAHLVWTAQQQQMIDRIEWSEERNKQEQSWISEKSFPGLYSWHTFMFKYTSSSFNLD